MAYTTISARTINPRCHPVKNCNDESTCNLIEGCPLQEDCLKDAKAESSLCPMKFLSFDEIASEQTPCVECTALSLYEKANTRTLNNQDRKDLSLYWMEHLNSHLSNIDLNEVRGDKAR
jgi:hypothetical protein